MKANRKFINNTEGNMGTVIVAIATAITIAIGIVIIYAIMSGINTTTIDANLRTAIPTLDTAGAPAGNATGSLIDGLGTFFTLSPIYLIVLVAVAIIGAVMGIMVSRRK